MIRPDKQAKALEAIQNVMIRARHLAGTGENQKRLVSLLDDGEYLPQLMLRPEDATEKFAAYLKGMKYPYIYEKFMED